MNFGSLVTRKKAAINYIMHIMILIYRIITWSSSAAILDTEAKILEEQLQMPKKLAVKMVGVRTLKSM
jgi:hypothetical protein